MGNFEPQNRGEIRPRIGRILNDVIVGTASTASTTTTLIDTYGLARGGDDEYNLRQILFTLSTRSSAKAFVSDFTSSSRTATFAPALTTSTGITDTYEMWKTFIVEDINDAINGAILYVDRHCLQPKVSTQFTSKNLTAHSWLSGFKGVHTVERLISTAVSHTISDCHAVWTESVTANVIQTLDTSTLSDSNSCIKLDVAETVGAGLLVTQVVNLDLSDCDSVELWIRSSVALSAADIQLLLDNTALCVSPVETLDIPATSANTSVRYSISLANPANDSAIISVGIKMAVDKGAFVLYVEGIKGVNSASRTWYTLLPEQWAIVKATTPLIQLSAGGVSLLGNPGTVRLHGYQLPATLSDDTTDCEIDPSWLVAHVAGTLLISHAKSSRLDVDDRAGLSAEWRRTAAQMFPSIRTTPHSDTRWV